MAVKKKKHSKKHIPAYLVGLIVMGVILNITILPGVIWLYYGNVVEAGFLDQVPYHIDESQIEEQHLVVVSASEERVIRIPITGRTEMKEEIAAGRLMITVDPGIVSDTAELTITADTDCLSSAALQRAGRDLIFEFMLKEELLAELSQSEEGLLITLKPITAAAGEVILIDARGKRQQENSALQHDDIAASTEEIQGADDPEHQMIIEIAENVQTDLSEDETISAQIYVIGNEKEPLSDEEYEAFIRQCAPTVYLRLSGGSEENGCALCNPRYFLPGLDSVVLAETILKNLVFETGETTQGVIEADETDPLRDFEIPAAGIILRDLTTETAESRQVYQDAAATGIARGLREALAR